MSSAPASPHASAVHSGRDVVPSPVPADAPAPAQPPLADAARRTVETVMIGADRYASDAKAVNLHFTVSGVDLAVHVALRGDAIHTTFRTDSPELRTALAEQWREVAGDRSERMADPVFSSTRSDAGLAGGDAQSRDSSARQQAQQAPATPWASTLARSTARTTTSVATPAALPAMPSRPATVSRLHAFA